jgi:hypothetical protein
MAAQLLFFENSSLAIPSVRPVHPAFWPSSAHYTFPSSPGLKTLHEPSWPVGLRSPLRPTQGSSPTSDARAAFGLAGAAAPLATISRPQVCVRSRSDAPPGHILFPHTNSTPLPLLLFKIGGVKLHQAASSYSPTASAPLLPNPIKGAAQHPLLPHKPLSHSPSFPSVPSFVCTRRSHRRFGPPSPASLRHCTAHPHPR